MPIPSQYLKQYYAQAMGDNYSPPQEGPNMPYILTPAQQQLAGILQFKQQQQQLEQLHGVHQPQYLQQQLLYIQQQHLLQQQQQQQQQHELNYRLEMQQQALNGHHHKQKKFERDHNNQSSMEHDKPIPPKPKIKVEPEDEPAQKEEEVLMDQDEDAGNRMSKEDHNKSLSQPKPPHLPPATSSAASPSSASSQTAQELTSSAVKKKLQTFVLNKQQRELAVASLTNDSAFKHWSQNMDKEGDDLGPLGSHLDANHFPLRKTASEPNLKVKSRLKAKVAEHRTIGSPLLHRPHRNGNKLHRSMTLETTGNENADRSNPGSPTQSVSASPGRERSSPLGAPGSTFGHSLPNLQAIPRLSANIDRSHISKLLANRYHFLNHASLASQGISNDAEFQSPYANDALYDSMEEDDDSSLNAAALKQVQFKNLALAKAQSKMLGLSGGHVHNSNSLLSRGQHPSLTGRGSPPSQNNLLSIPKSTLSPTSQASSLHHRPLRLTLSAPGYSISNNPQLQQQQILKQNQELLQQQQHLQFLQQQRLQQSQSLYLKQLQQDLLMQQLGKQNFPKVPQPEKEPRGTLKDHLEMLQFQKEQEQAVLKEKAYQQHKKEQQLAQAARTTEDLPTSRPLNEQQIQELLLVQQFQRQDPHQRGMLQQQLLQHQQLLQLRQAEVQAAPSAASASPSASIGHRPLARAISLPAVGSGQAATPTTRTGIVYDTLMLKHQCSCGDTSSHPEHPGRLQSIWARLQETGVTNICERVRPRKATLAEILTVHSEQHTMLYGGSTQCRTKAEDGTITTLKCFNTLPCGGMGVDGDTIWNEIHSANAARMAVGCVVELAYKVAEKELKNGMAIVRPPGHHAEAHQAMGFCYFNNVAIAARLLRLKMSVERVLIVDWDIHHGNGTQQMFYDDPHVLYISLHRHDDETFFPGTGKSEECGAGIGVGYNVNIAWNGGLDPLYGDAEYLAAFRSVVMPIAREFDPEIILVSAGFDAATGHSPQLGGYKVTAACFAQLTKQLMELAQGRLVMALEGGYSLPSLCDAAEACLRGLLSQELPEVPKESLTRPPNPNAVAVLEKTIAIQSRYWNSVKRTGSLINHSVVEAQQREKEELETVSALASLSMAPGVVQDSDKATDDQMEVQDES
ncbi:histone deacetylase 4-like isoform X2 [Actinia tenebrosa]|nr:histone deacetylase 4-like isoform X2 [Actinia tenebrosa]